GSSKNAVFSGAAGLRPPPSPKAGERHNSCARHAFRYIQEKHSMARRGNSVIGIDLGKRSYKAVLLSKKPETRYVLTNFASHGVPEELSNADDIGQHLKQLLRELGGSTRNCALAVSDPGSLLRIIEQPSTPPQ